MRAEANVSDAGRMVPLNLSTNSLASRSIRTTSPFRLRRLTRFLAERACLAVASCTATLCIISRQVGEKCGVAHSGGKDIRDKSNH